MQAYVGIGSNLGDRLGFLQAAVDGLDAHPGVEVTAVSGVYETAPVGGPPQPDYLNAVVALRSGLGPWGLLELGQALEAEAERRREQRWGPRTLDVDVLWVQGSEVAEPDLVVPHPRMAERGFVLVPLGELAPELVAPVDREVAHWTGVRRTDLSLRVP